MLVMNAKQQFIVKNSKIIINDKSQQKVQLYCM